MPRELRAHKIRQMERAEIEAKLRELRESQFNLRFRNSTNQLDNPLELRNVRREIAVINTVLRELDAKDEG